MTRTRAKSFGVWPNRTGLTVVAEMRAPRRRPDARYLVGSGKVEEVAERVKAEEIVLVLVNARLSPIQERNLVRRLGCNVLDRTTLILDIFAQRARSHEGKLQVRTGSAEAFIHPPGQGLDAP